MIYESENNYEKVPDMPRFAPFRRQFLKISVWEFCGGGGGRGVVLGYASAYTVRLSENENMDILPGYDQGQLSIVRISEGHSAFSSSCSRVSSERSEVALSIV